MGCERRHTHPLVAGTQTAGTIPGKFPNSGVSPPRLSLPPSLGSFPPSSATDFLPDSGCSDRGRNPCPVSASDAEKGTGTSSLGFSRKDPDCLRDGRAGGTANQKSLSRLFLSQPNPLQAPAQDAQLKHDTGKSPPRERGATRGARSARLTPSCLSSRQTGLSFMYHVAGSGLVFWIWMELVAFCPSRSKPN